MTATKTAPKKAAKNGASKGKAKSSKGGKGKATAVAPVRARKGLRDAQIRALLALSKAKGPLTKVELANVSPFDPTKTGVYIGPRAGESEITTARWPFPGLADPALGYVRVRPNEAGAGTVCELTAAGRAAIKKLTREEIARATGK